MEEGNTRSDQYTEEVELTQDELKEVVAVFRMFQVWRDRASMNASLNTNEQISSAS